MVRVSRTSTTCESTLIRSTLISDHADGPRWADDHLRSLIRSSPAPRRGAGDALRLRQPGPDLPLRAADGRTSLFAVDEIDALRTASRRADPNPRPTIDVQIASSITRLADDGVELRGFSLIDLQRDHQFEDVAELLLTGELPSVATKWEPPEAADVAAVVAPLEAMVAKPVVRLIVAATVLAGLHPDEDTATRGATAARRGTERARRAAHTAWNGARPETLDA